MTRLVIGRADCDAGAASGEGSGTRGHFLGLAKDGCRRELAPTAFAYIGIRRGPVACTVAAIHTSTITIDKQKSHREIKKKRKGNRDRAGKRNQSVLEAIADGGQTKARA